MKKRNVFLAEIGNPNEPRSLFGGSSNKNVLVIADDYNQAAAKAELYIEEMVRDEKKSILDGDGSLKDLENNKPKLLGLRISETELIW